MNQLTFENQPMTLIDHDGRLWLKSADIAKALGYARTDKLTRVYDRHASEFTASMTCVVETPTLGFPNLTSETRMFSLRGAHLLGMFARTANGMKFRKWVLDQLDAIEEQRVANRSLMSEWYDAKAALDNQNRFASLCGRGLNDHKKQKPPLMQRIALIAEKIQPSLSFS
ncbi:BRO family protein [Paraburkholderia phymatum]|uniref:BRO family protein n=1 Tax=Paraburkholderia phymatum TaxID=148447 RepID=A0ACC6U0Q8_9BURK